MKVLSAEEIAALTKAGGRRLAKPASVRADTEGRDLPPACSHEFKADKTLVTSPGRIEYPTKRCTICNIWLLGDAEEQVMTDAGDWLS